MGLDMYLYADKYVSGWDHNPHPEYKDIAKLLRVSDVIADDSPHMEVNVCVAYWRKANAIHHWFVQNIQDGKDECQRSWVPRTKLEELREVCQKALDAMDDGDKMRARSLLPPQEGFFFGPTDMDEWYEADLRSTIEQLYSALGSEALEDFEFYYQASW